MVRQLLAAFLLTVMLLILLAVEPAPVHAQSLLLQQNNGSCTHGSLPVAFPNNVASGDVVVVGAFGGDWPLSGITDSLGSTYTKAVSEQDATGSFFVYIYTATLSSSGSDSISASFSFPGPIACNLYVYEVSGVTANGAATASNYDNSGSNPSVSTSTSVSFPVGAFLLGMEGGSLPSTATRGAGFNLSADNSGTGLSHAEFSQKVTANNPPQSFVSSPTDFPMTLSAADVWVEVGIALAPTAATCIGTAVGRATACAQATGNLSGFTSVSASSLFPPPPAGVSFPFGVFSFTVTGIPPGGGVTITITLSNPFPSGTFTYYKFHGLVGVGVWTPMPASKVSLDPTRTIITLRLTDGATPDDADGSANGVIVDPGGPAIGTPTQPATHPVPVGGTVLPLNLTQVLGPWIAVMLTLTVVVVETLVIRGRKNSKR